jgi:hypothetical protein
VRQADLLLTTANEIRFRSMVELSLMLVAFSLLPFVPVEPEAASWRVASAVYSLCALLFVVHSVRRNRASMGRVLIAGAVTTVLLATCMGQFFVLALNAFGAFSGAESGVYFAALFAHFLGASFFFIRLLYGAFPRENPPAA